MPWGPNVFFGPALGSKWYGGALIKHFKNFNLSKKNPKISQDNNSENLHI